MVRLTAAIITYNEEKNIGRCLESLQGIADEIIVVDSGSTDATEAICKSLGAEFIVHPFAGHIEQKNFALSLCRTEYVLSLDADEALSEELRKSVLAVKQNWKSDGYCFNRLTNYCGQWIRHCGWYPDRKLRLFMKSKGQWGGTNPHDRLILANPDSTSFLKGDLLHYSYYAIREHIDQVNRFTEISSVSEYALGVRSSFWKILFKPCVRFLRDYFFRLGFLDGYYGFVICKISAYASFIKYVKLFELAKKKGS